MTKAYRVETKSDFLPFWSKGDIGILVKCHLLSIDVKDLEMYYNTGILPANNCTKQRLSLVITINNATYDNEMLEKYFGNVEADEIFKIIEECVI